MIGVKPIISSIPSVSYNAIGTTQSQKMDSNLLWQQLEQEAFLLGTKQNPIQEVLCQILGTQSSTKQLASPLEKWLTKVLTSAYNLSKDQKIDPTLFEDLQNKVGFENGFILLAKCYVLAYAAYSKSPKDQQELFKTDLSLIETHLNDLISKNSANYKTLLKNCELDKHAISQNFIQHLTQREQTERSWEKRKKMILIGSVVAVAALSILAFGFFIYNPIIETLKPLLPPNILDFSKPNPHVQSPTVNKNPLVCSISQFFKFSHNTCPNPTLPPSIQGLTFPPIPALPPASQPPTENPSLNLNSFQPSEVFYDEFITKNNLNITIENYITHSFSNSTLGLFGVIGAITTIGIIVFRSFIQKERNRENLNPPSPSPKNPIQKK